MTGRVLAGLVVLPTMAGLALLFIKPMVGLGLLAVPLIFLLIEIHAKLVVLEIRITEIQTDISTPTDPRDRFTRPGDVVQPRRTILHDIYDRLEDKRSAGG